LNWLNGYKMNGLLTRVIILGCLNISTVFSHAQTVVLCSSCGTVLCQPTGGRARLTEGNFEIFS
jgi:small subunit ribosomal protein S27e